MSVGEALTNIVWARVSALGDIRCSANWMWAPKLPGEGSRLYDAAIAMRDVMIEFGMAVDGGKDSLSMAAKVTNPDGTSETVKSPGTLVISAYVTCPDITKTVTPDLKAPGKSKLLFIDLGSGQNRLGGSALAQVFGQVGDRSPDLDDPQLLTTDLQCRPAADRRRTDPRRPRPFRRRACHNPARNGLCRKLRHRYRPGQTGRCDCRSLRRRTRPRDGISAFGGGKDLLDSGQGRSALSGHRQNNIGKTNCHFTPQLRNSELRTVLNEDMLVLRDIWEETSHQLDLLQRNPENIREERKNIYDRKGPSFVIPFNPANTSEEILCSVAKPKVAVIREEGSNGDREMVSAFSMAGFEPWDVTMTDLLEGRITLEQFRGIVFVGGFSYADVLDSAKGWAASIRFNKKVWDQFEKFYHRPDTFSLGVCNGCQLMALLGWVPWRGIADELQPRFIHNESGRFESRFSTVKILKSPSIMLKGMENSVLGIWVAHGEGLAYFPDKKMFKECEYGLAPIRYVDDDAKITEAYPFNPNGSPAGIAGLCSPDGRHLAMMPHPERTVLTWQWGWLPEDLKKSLKASPWLRMFQNAREWCEKKR